MKSNDSLDTSTVLMPLPGAQPQAPWPAVKLSMKTRVDPCKPQAGYISGLEKLLGERRLATHNQR
eukprot:5707529-Pyramimonas_sp.AAC.1